MLVNNRKSIAILITCYNRVDKTIECINQLLENEILTCLNYKIYLVDDKSPDGTGKQINILFPFIKVIEGTGELFWNKGMKLAWETAYNDNDYDFYIWLNDDTLLNKNGIKELINTYETIFENTKQQAIIVGACKNSINDKFSYGGRDDKGPIIPNGSLQECKYINGNVVLIPRKIFQKIGNLSGEYTHTIGDYDYGLRAIKEGFKCYTTKKYIAICPLNEMPSWCNPKIPILQRFRLMNSPKGLNLKEYIIFRKKFWGWQWIIDVIKVYIKVIMPRIYSKLKS